MLLLIKILLYFLDELILYFKSLYFFIFLRNKQLKNMIDDLIKKLIDARNILNDKNEKLLSINNKSSQINKNENILIESLEYIKEGYIKDRIKLENIIVEILICIKDTNNIIKKEELKKLNL